MSRVFLPVLALVLLLMAAPASAIPTCPAGTMADYLGFRSPGCQFNTLTFSNFSYSGIAKDFTGPTNLPAPPSVIMVEPFTAPGSLGSGGAGFEFTSPPSPPSPPGEFHLVHWGSVSIGFDVAAPAGWPPRAGARAPSQCVRAVPGADGPGGSHEEH